MLYTKGFLHANLIPKNPECTLDSCKQTKKLATTIIKAIDNNKKDADGKRKILSIVAEDYSLQQLNMLNASIICKILVFR